MAHSYLTATLLTILSSIVIAYGINHTVLTKETLDERSALYIILALIGINFSVLFLYRRMVKDAENKYRNLFADTPAGVCVLNPDKQLSIVLANKTFYKIMGADPRKAMSKKTETPRKAFLIC